MRTILGCVTVLVLASGATVFAQAKIDAKKIIGRWEPVPEKDKKAPIGPGMVVEFTDKGAISMAIMDGGKDLRFEGKYTLAQDKLSIELKLGEKEIKETLTIKSLNDMELITEDSKGKAETLRRKR